MINFEYIKMASSRRSIGIGILALAMILAGSACAPLKRPQTCQVHLNSGDGGSVDVSLIEPNRKLPFADRPIHVFWHPPTRGGAMDLVVGYGGSSISAPGEPTGGRVQFAPGIGSGPGQFQAVVTAGDAQVSRFGADSDFGSEQGDFIFSTSDPNGRAVTSAIAKHQIIKVVILKDGTPTASASFDTAATSDRDRLLDAARHIIETSDPRFCHTE